MEACEQVFSRPLLLILGRRKVSVSRSKLWPAVVSHTDWRRTISFNICMARFSSRSDDRMEYGGFFVKGIGGGVLNEAERLEMWADVKPFMIALAFMSVDGSSTTGSSVL
jgi:hypothetical protein